MGPVNAPMNIGNDRTSPVDSCCEGVLVTTVTVVIPGLLRLFPEARNMVHKTICVEIGGVSISQS